MNEESHGPVKKEIVELEVRTRHVLLGKGADLAHATVYCPVRDSSVGVGECCVCEHCAALRTDNEEHRAFVMCALDESRADIPVPDGSSFRDQELSLRTAAPVASIMTKDVVCVRREMQAGELTALLAEKNIHGVPVVDARGRPVGVITQTDLGKAARVHAEIGGLGPHVPVSALMTTTALCLHERATIAQAAALMAFEGVHLLPIVSDAQEVVGLISSLDILRWLGRRSGFFIPA
ncbi:MAG: CBS domain-containing protein [Byssovorax sp.]